MPPKSKLEKRLNKATAPKTSDVLDAVTVLCGLDALDGPDADTTAFRAALIVKRAGVDVENQILARVGEHNRELTRLTKAAGVPRTSEPGPVEQLLDDAAAALAMTPFQRALELGRLEKTRDMQGRGDAWRMWDRELRKQRDRFAAIPATWGARPAPVKPQPVDTQALLTKAMAPALAQIDALKAQTDSLLETLNGARR